MVGLTVKQKEERRRKDHKQIAAYAQAMMEKEFPSMGFPSERWAWVYSSDGETLIYSAYWPTATIRITGNQNSWTVTMMDAVSNLLLRKQERNLDLLSVRCVAIEWTKPLTQPQQEKCDDN